jgi:hypothetical protein
VLRQRHANLVPATPFFWCRRRRLLVPATRFTGAGDAVYWCRRRGLSRFARVAVTNPISRPPAQMRTVA